MLNTRWSQVGAALVLSYAILMLNRIMLIAFYPDAFTALNMEELLRSFLFGLRVDTAVILTFAGVPLLLLILPIKALEQRTLRRILGTVWGIIIAVIFVINYADDLYFGFVGRHVMNELRVIDND